MIVIACVLNDDAIRVNRAVKVKKAERNCIGIIGVLLFLFFDYVTTSTFRQKMLVCLHFNSSLQMFLHR